MGKKEKSKKKMDRLPNHSYLICAWSMERPKVALILFRERLSLVSFPLRKKVCRRTVVSGKGKARAGRLG